MNFTFGLFMDSKGPLLKIGAKLHIRVDSMIGRISQCGISFTSLPSHFIPL